MKFAKIAACAAAAAVAVSAMSMAVSAEDISINATLGFTDTTWEHQDWESAVEVTGDGTYTLTSTNVAGAIDFGVFVVDLNGMYAAYPEATATLDKIEIDGSELSFDASKILYGDIEEKGNFRIDIFNMYSDTNLDPGVNTASPINESLSVTFTVSGLGGSADAAAEEEAPAVEEAPAADSNTAPAATGNTAAVSIAAVMALAGAAALVSKRK